MVAFLVFIMATLEIVFGRKNVGRKNVPFGDNVYKEPARYLCMALYPYVKGSVKLWLC